MTEEIQDSGTTVTRLCDVLDRLQIWPYSKRCREAAIRFVPNDVAEELDMESRKGFNRVAICADHYRVLINFGLVDDTNDWIRIR